jgi:hypothetical protein
LAWLLSCNSTFTLFYFAEYFSWVWKDEQNGEEKTHWLLMQSRRMEMKSATWKFL